MNINTTCCIVGGGPSGMMLGLLLARAGIETHVLEKHEDFFRDFRGDTIHPSTLEILYELGILDEFLQHPHQKVSQMNGYIEDNHITVADFSKLKVHCPYIVFMPQWDFLSFLAKQAKKYPSFHLHMQTEATDLIKNNNEIVAVVANTPTGVTQFNAKLVVGADGRHSTIRACSRLKSEDKGAPMDVLWFRLSRKSSDPNEIFGKFSAGNIMIMINRDQYWQCGYVIPKGSAEILENQDISNFKNNIVSKVPFLKDRVNELKTWDDIKLLTVAVDRLTKWYMPGLLCIGDSAHAMSPIGGVGINLAIQDSVACANIITPYLKNNTLTTKILAKVQQRRMLATRFIQHLQVAIQNNIIQHVLKKHQALKMPWVLRQIQHTSLFRRIMGHIIGIGIRPEHLKVYD